MAVPSILGVPLIPMIVSGGVDWGPPSASCASFLLKDKLQIELLGKSVYCGPPPGSSDFASFRNQEHVYPGMYEGPALREMRCLILKRLPKRYAL